jgi:hypothetical protein
MPPSDRVHVRADSPVERQIAGVADQPQASGPSEGPRPKNGRGTGRFRRARSGVSATSDRVREWVDRQDPASPTGVAIGAWRRYRAVDGPLQSALLSLYVLVAVVPALLVMEEYLDPHPNALATHLVHHFGLNAPTGSLIRVRPPFTEHASLRHAVLGQPLCARLRRARGRAGDLLLDRLQLGRHRLGGQPLTRTRRTTQPPTTITA